MHAALEACADAQGSFAGMHHTHELGIPARRDDTRCRCEAVSLRELPFSAGHVRLAGRLILECAGSGVRRGLKPFRRCVNHRDSLLRRPGDVGTRSAAISTSA